MIKTTEQHIAEFKERFRYGLLTTTRFWAELYHMIKFIRQDDVAEIDRLRGERDKWHKLCGESDCERIELIKERDQLKAEVERLFAQIDGLRFERDLAIAHDRQPYPTAEAYELVCKARTRLDAEIERLNRIIAKELSENDELGAEFAYVRALQIESAQLREKLDVAEAEIIRLKHSVEYWESKSGYKWEPS